MTLINIMKKIGKKTLKLIQGSYLSRIIILILERKKLEKILMLI